MVPLHEWIFAQLTMLNIELIGFNLCFVKKILQSTICWAIKKKNTIFIALCYKTVLNSHDAER
jgi:hypothetical protein